MSNHRKCELTAEETRLAKIYFAVLIVIVFCGGIARTLQQFTNEQWFEGFVAIFSGLFIFALSWPMWWAKKSNPHGGFKVFVAWLAGVVFGLLGVFGIISGVIELLGATH